MVWTMSLLCLVFCSTLLLQPVLSATVKHDFNITWVWHNPDGVFYRPVIGVNDQWPLPQIRASVGDTVIVNVLNSLGNQSTSLHFHGLFMNGTSHMDGTSRVSQCEILPGSRFTYKFLVNQPGTYWYHSHTKSQYPDGLRGMLVVDDPESPYRMQYDEELVLSLSDWYNDQMATGLLRYDKKGGMPHDPAPDANLINDTVGSKIRVQPNRSYLVRLANIGALVGQYFWIEDHTVKVTEVDGVYTKPFDTDVLYLAPGQRYAFLLTTKENSSVNYPFVARMDKASLSMHDKAPTHLDSVAWLSYDDHNSFPEPQPVRKVKAFDDMALEPLDEEKLLEPVDQAINIDIDMHKKADGIVHWLFDTINYEPPALPSLFTALTSPNATNPQTYTPQTHTFVLHHNQVISLTIRNKHMRHHPIHLHGHNFQITHRSGPKSTINTTPPLQAPLRRDTALINGSGNLTIRFRADNPGVWIVHCHMEWHAHSGLVATIVEAPLELQRQQQRLGLQKIDLQAGPERVCRAMNEIVEADSRTRVYSSIAILQVIVVIVAIWLLAALGVYSYLRFVRRKKEGAAYSLLPIRDADDCACDADIDGGRNEEVEMEGKEEVGLR